VGSVEQRPTTYKPSDMTHQAVVQWSRQVLQIEPDVEGARWGDIDPEPQLLEALEDMVTLSLEMLLQSDLEYVR
jgi:hypothetical protein